MICLDDYVITLAFLIHCFLFVYILKAVVALMSFFSGVDCWRSGAAGFEFQEPAEENSA
jgi:hypothetical protein